MNLILLFYEPAFFKYFVVFILLMLSAGVVMVMQLKAVCVGRELTVTHEFCVVYDKDLPEFK